ncbi:MAG: hypothetical protein GTN93_01050 [Anaerolineae bacterium]|nr:hypothetical protein [Anaerolineae bacterium]
MKELSYAICREATEAKGFPSDEEMIDDGMVGGVSDTCPELHIAALKWSDHALRTFTGPTLRKALAISEALCDFSAWMDKLAKQ